MSGAQPGEVTPAAEYPPILAVLEMAKREFLFAGGCVMTDRPDLPLSPETSWTADFSRVVAAIDDAVDLLVGVECRSALRCAGCSTNQPTLPISARTKYVPAHGGSRTAAKGRS